MSNKPAYAQNSNVPSYAQNTTNQNQSGPDYLRGVNDTNNQPGYLGNNQNTYSNTSTVPSSSNQDSQPSYMNSGNYQNTNQTTNTTQSQSGYMQSFNNNTTNYQNTNTTTQNEAPTQEDSMEDEDSSPEIVRKSMFKYFSFEIDY